MTREKIDITLENESGEYVRISELNNTMVIHTNHATVEIPMFMWQTLFHMLIRKEPL